MLNDLDHEALLRASTESKKWSMLLIYNIYRLVSIALLFGLFWIDAYHRISVSLFCSALFLYFLLAITLLHFGYVHRFRFKSLVLWSGTIDTIVMVIFIHVIGYIQSGLGILLNVTIAMLSILIPGQLAIFFAAVASCMMLGISIFQYEYNIPLQNMNTFFSTGIYCAGFFATSLTAWYFAHLVRMSERLAKDRGKELESMQRLNEYIVGRLQYGVIYVDPNLQIKVINRAAARFFNVDLKPCKTLPELSPALYEKYRQFLARKKHTNLVHAIHAVLDDPYLQVHFFPTTSAMSPAVLIILDDMTLIAKQVQQLKLASLGRFSASIAHELRNPLGVISHAIQLLGEDGDLAKEDLRLKELIMNNCKRMNSVIQNVLGVSRRQQAKSTTIKLTHFLKKFKLEFSLINPCEITLNIPQNKEQIVVFDESQLEQVLVILCDNAMQHGRDEQGKVQIDIQLKHENNQLVLILHDTGPGISPDLRKKIFEPFFSTHASGNGMGLFIAKELCEINQTRLNLIESTVGTCFSITFNSAAEVA